MAHDSPAAPTPVTGAREDLYRDLHAERASLERDLALAKARQSFSTKIDDVERAHADEADMLARLDLVLTRIRAAEYQRRPGARRW